MPENLTADVILFDPAVFFYVFGYHLHLHSFPTRRSSDLGTRAARAAAGGRGGGMTTRAVETWTLEPLDRKSTRLNSSHLGISYAVFCLKKKMGTDDSGEFLADVILRQTHRTGMILSLPEL